MVFVDFHNHSLPNVDDGARSFEEACAMVDASYADGVRVLFLTPHFRPGAFGDSQQKSLEEYARLRAYIKQAYPKMATQLLNELHYSRDCLSWLDQGLCRTLAQSRYVLVDFPMRESKSVIMDGLWRLLGSGYIPILAHPERYRGLSPTMGELRECRRNGVLLQMDAQSPLGGFGAGAKVRAFAMLHAGLVDFVGSDAHDCQERPPQISEVYELIAKRYGANYADAVCRENALHLLRKIKSENELD